MGKGASEIQDLLFIIYQYIGKMEINMKTIPEVVTDFKKCPPLVLFLQNRIPLKCLG
jgi:hypothetical protein